MSQSSMLLICDIDGTIANSTLPLQMYIWDQYKVIIREESLRTYRVEDSIYEQIKRESPFPPNDKLHLSYYLGQGFWRNPALLRTFTPNLGLWDAVRNWPGPIKYATKRHASLADETRAWLMRHGFMDGADRMLVHAMDKVALVKTCIDDLARKLYYDHIYFIDDCAETCLDVRKAIEPVSIEGGFPIRPASVMCPQRRWNEWAAGELLIMEDALISDALRSDTKVEENR